MPSDAERFTAATAYVRRAIAAVEAQRIGYLINPLTGVVEWFASRTKTRVPRAELARIDQRWKDARTGREYVQIARDAELLADRVEENLPGAPQDRPRTNLFVGEQPTATPDNRYADELVRQTEEIWQTAEQAAERVSSAAASAGRWIVAGGVAVGAYKLIDYLRTREHNQRAKREIRYAFEQTRRRNAEGLDGDRHWHVLAGLCGPYIPDLNEVFGSREDAEGTARALAERYAADGETVTGSAHGGYLVGANHCIDVASCNHGLCTIELDGEAAQHDEPAQLVST